MYTQYLEYNMFGIFLECDNLITLRLDTITNRQFLILNRAVYKFYILQNSQSSGAAARLWRHTAARLRANGDVNLALAAAAAARLRANDDVIAAVVRLGADSEHAPLREGEVRRPTVLLHPHTTTGLVVTHTNTPNYVSCVAAACC